MPRPPRTRMVRNSPRSRRFGPYDLQPLGEVVLSVDGLEALHLSDVEGCDQQTAAEHMGVSRQTFGRILARARQAVATAVTGGFSLRIEGGAYQVVEPGRAGRRNWGRGRGLGGGGRGRRHRQ